MSFRAKVVIVCLAALAVAAGTIGWLHGYRSSPSQVVLVYVREENSLGLVALPPEEVVFRVGLVVAGDVVLVPGDLGRIPAGTRVLVVRETYVAGVLAESRAVFLRNLPGLVEGRIGPAGEPLAEGLAGETLPGQSRLLAGLSEAIDESCALLSADIELTSPSEGTVSVVVDGEGSGPEEQVALEPGLEWRLTAVAGDDSGPGIYQPGDPGSEAAIRQAFRDGRPVSILSVVCLGLWDTDRIETGSDGEG